MIKDNQKYFNRMHVVIDGFVIAGSYWLAWVAKFIGPFAEGSVQSLSFRYYFVRWQARLPANIVL